MERLSRSKSPAVSSPAPNLMTSRIPKNPCENSGASEPATSPVVPQFPLHRNFRGNDSEKRGIRAGKFQGSPAGIGEVTFSDVTAAESGEGMWFGTRRAPNGDRGASSPGTSGIKRNSTEHEI